jgi:hypothetical protein
MECGPSGCKVYFGDDTFQPQILKKHSSFSNIKTSQEFFLAGAHTRERVVAEVVITKLLNEIDPLPAITESVVNPSNWSK